MSAARPGALRAAVALAALAAPLPAGAHVGAPLDAVDLHPQPGGGLVLQASVGLVHTSDGEDWRWICHEAVTTPEAVILPRYAVAGRRWLVTVPELAQARDGQHAVWWTDDGCTWAPSGGLTGQEVPAIAISADGAVALAATTGPEAPGLHRSTDGGASFGVALQPGGPVTSAWISPDGAHAWATADLGDAGHLLLHSADGGLSWTARPADPALAPPGIGLRVLAGHPSDAAQAWLVVDDVGPDRLLHATGSGAALRLALSPDGAITDAEVRGDGEVWLAFAGTAFLQSADGVDFQLVEAAPPGLGLAFGPDAVWLATRFELLNSAVAVGDPAAGFTPTFSFVDLDGPLACPAGTEGAEVCVPLYGVLEDVLIGGGLDSGAAPDSGGTPAAGGGGGAKERGCGGGALGVLALLGLGASRRRPQLLGAGQGPGGHGGAHGGVEVP
jgi:hypothetical protein